jgi:osmotically-inducible protein OsmY
MIANGLAKQDISYDARNGVLTLKGKVKTSKQRQEAQEIANHVPYVVQVVNQVEVRR